MEEFLGELVVEFKREVTRRAIRATADTFIGFFRNNANHESDANTQLSHVGFNYYSDQGGVLWYNFLTNRVYAYKADEFGDQWVNTNFSIDSNPHYLDLGNFYAHDKLYHDAYGNLYYGQ